MGCLAKTIGPGRNNSIMWGRRQGITWSKTMKSNLQFHVSRRSFMKHCATIAAATGLPVWFWERELSAQETAKAVSSNDRPGIGLVGCGGMGKGDAQNASPFGDIVAVCDLDKRHVEEAVKQFTKDGKVPASYSDFRKLIARDDVHVIINAPPDHWHTLVSLAATNAKKDIY